MFLWLFENTGGFAGPPEVLDVDAYGVCPAGGWYVMVVIWEWAAHLIGHSCVRRRLLDGR